MGISLILGAAGAGRAKGKFNRQELDKEEMQQALLEHHRQTQEQLESRRLSQADRERSDLLKFRVEDAKERGKDRDADRNARLSIAHEQSADRADARTARKEAKELRPDEREKAADEFAYRMVAAANGDPRVAQDFGARDMPTAKKLGLRRDHYYAAAQRYKDRLTAKSKPAAVDEELEGGSAPPPRASAPPALKPLTDADRQKAASDPDFAAYLKNRGYTL